MFVFQPRRVAAVTVARRVAAEMGVGLGELVRLFSTVFPLLGYQLIYRSRTVFIPFQLYWTVLS